MQERKPEPPRKLNSPLNESTKYPSPTICAPIVKQNLPFANPNRFKLMIIKWWFRCKELILAFGLLFLLTFIPFFVAEYLDVKQLKYGPLVFSLFWYGGITFTVRTWRKPITNWLIGHRDESDRFSLQSWFRYSPLVVFAILVAYSISDNVKQSLNPIGYWEERANNGNSCLDESTVLDLREKVVVAANKLNMGIGTTRELREAKDILDLLTSSREACIERQKFMHAEANRELAKLQRANPSQGHSNVGSRGANQQSEIRWEDVRRIPNFQRDH